MERHIQEKIRILRKASGLSLRQLAERVGCTHSYISQIEKGVTVPSLSMVGKLAMAFQLSVIDLFEGQRNSENSDSLLTKKDRRTIKYPDGKISSELLVSRISNKKIEPLVSVIRPGGSSDAAEPMTHPLGTEEFVFVLRGELSFQLDGKEMHLVEGDTLIFNGALPHNWTNKGNKNAHVLFVFSPPIW